MQTPTRTVRMDDELYRKLTEEAKKHSWSFSVLVVKILEGHLADVSNKEKGGMK